MKEQSNLPRPTSIVSTQTSTMDVVTMEKGQKKGDLLRGVYICNRYIYEVYITKTLKPILILSKNDFIN